MPFVAVLTATLPLAKTGQVQLLPAGRFTARDGRPNRKAGDPKYWEITEATGPALAAVVTAAAALNTPVIDYEHQTLNAVDNGKPAPAAGWIQDATWVPGKGLYGTVNWTAAAKAYIDAEEYRFFSPVITYDKTGAVTGVLMGAITNYPALVGMDAVVAQLTAQFPLPNDEPESHMDLAKLLAALGLPATTTEAQVLEHVAALKAKPPVPALPKAVLTALALGDDATETQALSAVAALKGGDQAMSTLVLNLQNQVAALTSTNAERDLVALVDGAIKDKKYVPAMRDSLLAVGRKDMTALKALVDNAPAIPGLDGQTGGNGPADQQTAVLSAAGSQVMAAFGLTQEQFDKAKPKAA